MDEESGLAVPQHRDTVCWKQKQLPDGPRASRAGVDVSPLGLASRRLPGSGSAVVRGRGRGAGLCCALLPAPCWPPYGSGRAQTKEAGAKLCFGCVRVCRVSPGGSFSPLIREAVGAVLGLLLRLLGSLCCSQSRVSLAWCLDFPSSTAPVGIPSPCAEGTCGILALSRLGTTGMKMQLLVMRVMEESGHLIPREPFPRGTRGTDHPSIPTGGIVSSSPMGKGRYWPGAEMLAHSWECCL